MLEALAVKTEVIYLLQCDVLQAWEGGVRGRWFGVELSKPSDSSPQHLMLSKLLYCKNWEQIMHNTWLISHIRHMYAIQTFNYIHRKLFGEHIFCPLTSRTLWFKSSKACFELHKIIFEAITVNLNV